MDAVQPTQPQPTPQPTPAAPPATVSFAEFKKLEIRLATIKSVEDHPNANKLYVVKVDLGAALGERQVVAGLKSFYTPEQLVGKTVAMIVNIEPAMLRGVQSQGMLLAAADGARVLVLQPDGGTATAGSKVS